MKCKRRSVFANAMASFFTENSSPPKLKRSNVPSISRVIQSTSQASASKSKLNEFVGPTNFQFLKKTENNLSIKGPIKNEISVNHSIKNISNEFSNIDPPVMIFLEEPSTHKFRDESDDNLNLSPYVSDEDCKKSETKFSDKTNDLIEEIAKGWESEKDNASEVDVEENSVDNFRLSKKNERIIFTCHICGNCYETKNILEQHMQEHNINEDQLIRNINLPKNLVTEQTASMGNEVSCVENISLQKGVNFKDLRLTCQYCDESFVDQLLFINHCRMHMVDKPYICTVCGILFEQKKALIHHKKIHLKKKTKR